MWPLPRSSASIPEVYAEIAAESEDQRAVLDLPAEVGTTMATSRYFLYQTRHGKPIPYSPDIRAGSSSDQSTFFWLEHPRATRSTQLEWSIPKVNRAIESRMKSHLSSRYGWVILHREEAERAGVSTPFYRALVRVLGEPKEYETLWLWRI